MWKDLQKTPLSEQSLIQSFTNNINTAALLQAMMQTTGSSSLMANIDWQKILKDGLATGSIKIPGMSSQISLNCAGDLYQMFAPLMNISLSDPTKIAGVLGLPIMKSKLLFKVKTN